MAANRTSAPRRWLAALVIMALQAQALAAPAGAGAAAAPAEALAVMEAFMRAFNARDEAAWADTLHFPHVRIASGGVTLYADRAAFLEGTNLADFAENIGWDHSAWDDLQVIQSGAGKVHIAVNFTRYDAQGGVIGSYASLYVLENLDGRWGVRARSSFAP
jgi:hypothetical protein